VHAAGRDAEFVVLRIAHVISEGAGSSSASCDESMREFGAELEGKACWKRRDQLFREPSQGCLTSQAHGEPSW
jgi:hypothetical protein